MKKEEVQGFTYGVSKSMSIAVLKDKLMDMRGVYEHVFSSIIWRGKTFGERMESYQWLMEIKRRMLDLELTIFQLENQ